MARIDKGVAGRGKSAGQRVPPEAGEHFTENREEVLRNLFEPSAPQSERRDRGKALRASLPRAELALHRRVPGSVDPVAIIKAQNATRIQGLVPVRMGRMMASPFGFLRGSAAVMAADLAAHPTTGVEVIACGDMHLSNFGLFASAERNLVFAINDFDEVHPGPWEWDLKRLAASAAVAARYIGGDDTDAALVAFETVRRYVEWINIYSRMGILETWYSRIDEDEILAICPPDLKKVTKKLLARARARGHISTMERLTHRVEGETRLIEDTPIIVRETHTQDGVPIDEALNQMLRAYIASLTTDRRELLKRYRVADVVRKVVGVGSVGLDCWVLYLQGDTDEDPLFLQVKEARESVLAPHVRTRVMLTNQGHRVVSGQRVIQGSPDIFLGWGPLDDQPGRQYYVRQLADMKGSLKFIEGERTRLAQLLSYVRLCGRALALAHAKSGDPSVIAGYCGRSEALPEAISRFALAYMAQTFEDHDRLEEAARRGEVPVAMGL